MGKGFNQLALEALERGDTKKAKFWIEKNEETKYAIHDLYLHWIMTKGAPIGTSNA